MFYLKGRTENLGGIQLCKSCNWVSLTITSLTSSYNLKKCGWAIAALLCGVLAPFTYGITEINKFPQTTVAESAKFESARVAVYKFIDANDEPNTLIAIDKFIGEFKDNQELPGIVYDFAARVDRKNWYEPNRFTESIYKRIVDDFPKNSNAQRANLNIARINITSLINFGDDANAFTHIDKLIRDFNSCPDLPNAISQISLKCYNDGLRMYHKGNIDKAKENYQKSINVLEIIIHKLPLNDLMPQAYFQAAVLYSGYLGQYQKGIEYFQKILDDWPSSKYALDAQFLIGVYYKELRDSGVLTPSKANPKIEQAYETFIKKYPDDGRAPFAALELGHIKFMKEQWLEAVTYFKIYLANFPEQLESIISPLGQAYEEMGQKENALELYRSFIKSPGAYRPMLKAMIQARLETLEGQDK